MKKRNFVTMVKVISALALTAMLFSCSDVDDDDGRYGLNPDNLTSPTGPVNPGGGQPTSVPSTPTGVTASAQSSSSIRVSWNPVSGATGYYVYRSTSSSGSFSQVTTTSSTSWTNTGLSANTTYWYRVAAYNSRGTGSQSSSTSARTSSSSGTTSNGACWCSYPGTTYTFCVDVTRDICDYYNAVGYSCSFSTSGRC